MGLLRLKSGILALFVGCFSIPNLYFPLTRKFFPIFLITSLLKQGWDAMGLPSLKYRINESLKIQESMSLINETRIRLKSNRAIDILFGFIAFPQFAYQVLKPFWLYTDISRTENE